MDIIRVVFILLLTASLVGCDSVSRDTSCFHAGGWEDAQDAKADLDTHKQVFTARIFEDHWEDPGPGREGIHHFKAEVVKSYRGEWRAGERIGWRENVDMRATIETNRCAGLLQLICTDEHTNAEIWFDTGDARGCDADIEHALELVYPNRNN